MSHSVSVVIPTLDRCREVLNTLKDLLAQDYSDFDILVLDQTDKPSPELTGFIKNKPQIHYFHLDKKSSPHARNIGAQKAKGEILLFLDDDVSIQNKSFIWHHLDNFNNPEIGLVGGRVVYGDENPNHREVGKLKFWALKEITHFDSTKKMPIDHAPGGNMSVRKKVFLAVGGFSEIKKGNAHMEETDFCLRVKRAGHKAIFEPQAVLKHLQVPRGGNRARDIYEFRYWLVHNFVVFYLKNYPKILFPLCFIKEFVWALGSGLKRKYLEMFKIMYKAIINGVNYYKIMSAR